MGSDNLHHKRRQRNDRSLDRSKGKKAKSRDKKILIVCEGEKTEPNYFTEARQHYSLDTGIVEIRGDCGSDPMSIVNFAKTCYQDQRGKGDPFDQVYCVFDKDDHSTYKNALAALSKARPKGVYITINSVPCFEYWLLLHFSDSTRPYNKLPDNSAGNQVLRQLKQYMPTYKKTQRGLFIELLNKLEQAKCHAEHALAESERNQTDNPSTQVHKLIETLQKLNKAKKDRKRT